ncbi:MAG TPA: hypothetical protein VLL98_03095 [Rickettsiales bacterium]|nr:hypothetical protein [Rickettsiales bacterium]
MNYKTQLSYIENSTVIKNITESSLKYLVYNILNETKFKFFVYICNSNFDLELAKKEIEFYSKDIEILTFPEWNTMPYDVNSPDLDLQTKRMDCIYKLIKQNNDRKTLLIISRKALVQKIINRKDFKFINFYINQKLTIDETIKILEENCYSKTETVYNIGDYCINNSTVDFITFNNQAYRISIEKDVIKEIKTLDTNSQIASKNHKEILLLPIKEVFFNQNNIQNFRQNYKKLFGIPIEKDTLYNIISNNQIYDGFENWLPLFYENELESIFDYIPKTSVLIYENNTKNKINDFYELIQNYYNLRIEQTKQKEVENIYNPIPIEMMYLENFNENISKYINIIFDIENSIKNERQIELDFKNLPEFYKDSNEVFKSLKEFL